MAKAFKEAASKNGSDVIAKPKPKPGANKGAAIIEDITHEEIEGPGTGTAEIVTIETTVRTEIKKFHLSDAAIAELKKKYGNLTIAGNDDNKSYELVKKARAEVRSYRTGIEKKRKDLKADYIAIGKAIDGEASRITDLLLEVETPLDIWIKKHEEEKERLKQEAEEKAQQELQGRVNSLIENGMAFNGKYYSIGETISIDIVTLKNFTSEEFTILLDRVKIENKAIADAKAAELKRQEDERLEFQRKQDEQAQMELQLQKEKEQQEKERLEIIKERRNLRAEKLEALGFVYNYKNGEWRNGEQSLNVGDLGLRTAEHWAVDLELAKEAATKESKRLEDLRQRKVLTEQRKTELFNLGFKFANGQFFITTESFGGSNFYPETVLNFDELEWAEFVKTATGLITETRRKDAENIEETKKRIEAEKTARLSDAEKAAAYLNGLDEALLKYPGFFDKEVAKICDSFYQQTRESLRYAKSRIESL